MENIKNIGVLTSGGDAPGMNAAIRSVVRTAISRGINVYGIRNGYKGLIQGDIKPMKKSSVADILHRGGTMLFTARCLEFKTEEGMQQAIANCKKYNINGIIVIGGDGSFRGARELSLKGIPCVGIPATIDNDIGSSEYTIGFDTAMNTVVEAIDKIRDTSESHSRCSIVEVMGNGAGHLAINAAVACGAMACVVKEMEVDPMTYIVERMYASEDTGYRNFIAIVAEGLTDIHQLAKNISEKTEIETRATVLGHIQRGGTPLTKDRVIATMMGNYAVDMLSKGIGNRVVVEQSNKLCDFDILEALEMNKSVNYHMLEVNKEVLR